MLCRSPIFLGKRRLEDLSTLFPDGKSSPLFVPCGVCKSCRINRARVWITRMSLESRLFRHSLFLTLTYNDDHLPEGGNLSPKDVTNFFKRLRNRIGSFRYYLCAEYGPKGTHRPHYHAILFGVSEKQKAAIEDSWCDGTSSKGFVYLGNVTKDSIGYVAGYVVKRLRYYVYDLDQHLVRPFSRMSKGCSETPGGLGYGALPDIARQLRARLVSGVKDPVPYVLKFADRVLPIGRYLRQKLLEMLGLFEDKFAYHLWCMSFMSWRNGLFFLDKYWHALYDGTNGSVDASASPG